MKDVCRGGAPGVTHKYQIPVRELKGILRAALPALVSAQIPVRELKVRFVGDPPNHPLGVANTRKGIESDVCAGLAAHDIAVQIPVRELKVW